MKEMQQTKAQSRGRIIPPSEHLPISRPSASKSHAVNGSGEIDLKKGGNRATFRFTIDYDEGDPVPRGFLTYQDSIAMVYLKASIFNMLVVEDSLAWFSGTGMLEGGKAVRFAVEVNTNQETFHIHIPTLGDWVGGGQLARGGVTIL